MAEQRLDARYDVICFLGRAALGLGFAAALWLFASNLQGDKWLAVICYVIAAATAIGSLCFVYRPLVSSKGIVLSLDAEGVRDTRLTPALIPWSAIESVSLTGQRVLSKFSPPPGVQFVVVPAFRQKISVRPGNKLCAGVGLWAAVLWVDTGVLDVSRSEVLRVANVYLSKRS